MKEGRLRPDRERRIRQATGTDSLFRPSPFPVYTVADERMPLAIDSAFYEAVNLASTIGLLQSMECILTVPPDMEEPAIRDALHRIVKLQSAYPALCWKGSSIRVSATVSAAMIQFRMDGISLPPNVVSGMTVIQTGNVAHSGALQLYLSNPSPIDKHYNGAFEMMIRQDASRWDIRRSRATAMASDYPIFAAGFDGINGLLYRMQETGIGMILDAAAFRIPVATVEICEAYGVDPMDLPAIGGTLMLTENPDRLREQLMHRGVEHAVVGLTEGRSVRIKTASGIRHIAAPDGMVFYEAIRRRPLTE